MTEQMSARDLVLAIVGSGSGDSDLGRTTLQKIAYLYGIAHGRDLGHRPYYYGPFSSAVERDVEALTVAGLVDEHAAPLGFVTPSGRPATRYRYTVTADGQRRLARLAETYAEEAAGVAEFVRLLARTFGTLNQNDLSIAAKTLFIARDQARPLTTEEVSALAKDYGWDVGPRQVDQVVEMLAGLRLVTTAR